MIKTLDRIINQLLPAIYIDKQDNSVIRINFLNVLQTLDKFDIIVPPKALESMIKKVMEERLVGKIEANDTAKWVVAQAILNTAMQIALSKEELLKIKLKNEGVQHFDKK